MNVERPLPPPSANHGRRQKRAHRSPQPTLAVQAWSGCVLRRIAGAASVLLFGIGLIGAAALLWIEGWPQRLAAAGREAAVLATAGLGFTVREVFVVGRQDTPKQELMDALGVTNGDPMLALDLDAARERILSLPWVHEAQVERQLPSTVLVHVSERRPVALWQNRGQFSVIDERGEVLTSGDCSPYAHLPRVVGDDAARHVAELLEMLKLEPDLAKRVTAAVRVGGRRWNLTLAGGIDIRLPEEAPAAAWRRLAEYHRAHHLLDKRIESVDLRLPDRLVVKRAGGVPLPADGFRKDA